jgi:hypothetical protein
MHDVIMSISYNTALMLENTLLSKIFFIKTIYASVGPAVLMRIMSSFDEEKTLLSR